MKGSVSKGLLAISPLAVFLLVYLVSSVVAGDFYKVPVSAAFLLAGVYGIAVAKLAGMPEPVLARARQILANLEANEISEATGQPAFASTSPRPRRAARPGDDRQMTLF